MLIQAMVSKTHCTAYIGSVGVPQDLLDKMLSHIRIVRWNRLTELAIRQAILESVLTVYAYRHDYNLVCNRFTTSLELKDSRGKTVLETTSLERVANFLGIDVS